MSKNPTYEELEQRIEKMNKNILFILLVSILVIFGCTEKQNDNKKKKGLQEITVKLKYFHQAQFAGNYVANEKGFYADEGLKVNLVPFSFEEPVIDAVLNGKAVFGITGAIDMLLARAQGLPIKSFAVIYKVSPICAYSLKESGIIRPQDFIGKTIGLEKAADIEIAYSVMMARLGIDRNQVKEVTIGFDATDLLAGTVDVATGYIVNEPQQVIETGQKVNTILMAEYGVNIYADVLFTTEDTINNNSELVEGFLRATLKGWQYTIEHEEEAVGITLKYATDRTKSRELFMLRASIPLIHTGNSPIGWMEKAKWEKVQNILLEQKILDKKMDLDKVYTTQFLEKIYREK